MARILVADDHDALRRGLALALSTAGHDVEVLPDAYSDTMGHAGAVVMHPNGSFEGAHDPRADGGAAGV